MAVEAGKEEADYESDPEESVLPLAMRRREASDDEEGDEGGERRETRSVPRAAIGSDGESDGQGGAPVYDDDEEESEMDEEEEEGEEVEEGEEIEEEQVEEFDAMEVVAVADSGGQAVVGSGGKSRGVEEEKRESEPFAVPTAGAFYMHDDRFRDNGGGRHR